MEYSSLNSDLHLHLFNIAAYLEFQESTGVFLLKERERYGWGSTSRTYYVLESCQVVKSSIIQLFMCPARPAPRCVPYRRRIQHLSSLVGLFSISHFKPSGIIYSQDFPRIRWSLTNDKFKSLWGSFFLNYKVIDLNTLHSRWLSDKNVGDYEEFN